MARQANPLTDRKVRTNPAGTYADGNGLYLIVDASGARRWISRVQVKGMVTASGKPKRMEIGLGNTEMLSLAEARIRAIELKRMAWRGINPLQNDETRIPSFQSVFEEWFESYSAGLSNAKHTKQWPNTMRDYVFPHIGGIRVDLIEQSHVLQCVEPIWNTKHETAKRVLQRIAKVLDIARAKQYRSGENPVEIIKRANILTRTRVAAVQSHAAMNWAELPEFWKDLIQQTGVSSLALQFTILTASRTCEVLGLKWSEIDLGQAIWTIPASRMKARRPHAVPLSEQVFALLLRMHNTKRSEYVFEGQKRNAPLSNMAMMQLLKRMDRNDITVHGFRSSFRDWCGDNAIDRELAELSLAHSLGNAVEQAYARSDLIERRREVMQSWAQFVAPIIE